MATRRRVSGTGAAGLALVLLSLGTARNASAVFEPLDPNPRSRAMGGAFTGADAGAFSLFHNPAGLEVVDHVSVGISYVQPYSVDFLKMTAAGFSIPLPGPWGAIGVGFRRLATDYMEQSLDEQNTWTVSHGFSLYKDVSSTVAFGYGLNLYSLKFGPTVNEIDPGRCPIDRRPLVAKYSLRPHGDHNPKHGGHFIMAPNNWHVEATHPATAEFRLYVYDEYSRPFIPKGFTSRIVVDDTSIPFRPAPTRAFLAARVPQAALPATIVVKARFEEKQPEYQFDFQFYDYSKEPK